MSRPKLRIDKEEFTLALHLGLGRAILWAQRYDLNEFRGVILDACLHCYSYDVQVEGTRADFMFEMTASLPDADFYRAEVLGSLQDCGDNHDARQRFHFAARMAREGNAVAKDALYKSYVARPKTAEAIGIEFVKLDGMAGLLYAAEKIGEMLESNSPDADIGWLHFRSTEILGEQATDEALRDAAQSNPAIERYRSLELRNRVTRESAPRAELPALSYEQLMEDTPPHKPYVFRTWGKRAQDEELLKAAHGLVAAIDPLQQRLHLHIFAGRTFPLDARHLLRLIEIDEERVGPAAMRALEAIERREPRLRELAIRLVETRASSRESAVRIIGNNFEPGDHELILHWFAREDDADVKHNFGTDMFGFWDRHPDAESEGRAWRAIYETGPCSSCRERAVKGMIRVGTLTKELREECAWDADVDIRELVAPASSPRAR